MTKQRYSAQGGMSAGPSTDAANVPVIDPTKNVLDLVALHDRRQDDLRLASEKYLADLATLRAQLGEQLRVAESQRVDANRATDLAQVASARTEAEARATTLAAQVTVVRDTLAGQVQAAAVAQTQSLTNALQPIIKDVSELRQVQFQQQGERASAHEYKQDAPSMAMLMQPVIAELKDMRRAQDQQQGELKAQVELRNERRSNTGVTQQWVYILVIGAIFVIGFLASHYH